MSNTNIELDNLTGVTKNKIFSFFDVLSYPGTQIGNRKIYLYQDILTSHNIH